LLAPPPPFVSRAGGKLSGAIDRFGIDPTGFVCVDAGSSTGGFTDCLLQLGAKRVHAIDVGTNQLHERLRADNRVDVREQTDVRNVTADQLGGVVDLVVGDLSFISLRRVLPALVALVKPGGPLLLLIKPQFEAGRQEASKGRGIITDPAIWARVLGEVADAAPAAGAAMLEAMASPVPGSSGNVEFIGRFIRGEGQLDERDIGFMIGSAVASGQALL
jgi:23S rRNA (cytidine1920-2'-O)/16S rRNA (cytidine1409-2'-O)-methyltransferase